MKWVGRAMRRLEDPALVQGRGRFTADLAASHAVRFVRSAVASGRIVAITAPDGAPVFTGADLAGVRPIAPMLHKFNYRPIAQPILAQTWCALSANPSRPCSRRAPPRPRTSPISRGRDRGTAGAGRRARRAQTRRAAGARQLRRQCRGRRRLRDARFRRRHGAGEPAHRRRRCAPTAKTRRRSRRAARTRPMTRRAAGSRSPAPPRCRI